MVEPVTLIANARMYTVVPRLKYPWRALFAAVSDLAGISLTYEEHTAPRALHELWQRADLGCAFMCGWPLASTYSQHSVIAAPVPEEMAGPTYRTHFLARARDGFEDLSDLAGRRLGWTVTDSHSGFNAPRHYLAVNHPDLEVNLIGPLVTPRRAVEALQRGEIDVAPVDSYALSLLLRYDEALLSDLRIIESTDESPIPPIVAGPALSPPHIKDLRQAFLSLRDTPRASGALDQLGLTGFAPVSREIYSVTLERAAQGEGKGPMGKPLQEIVTPQPKDFASPKPSSPLNAVTE